MLSTLSVNQYYEANLIETGCLNLDHSQAKQRLLKYFNFDIPLKTMEIYDKFAELLLSDNKALKKDLVRLHLKIYLYYLT